MRKLTDKIHVSGGRLGQGPRCACRLRIYHDDDGFSLVLVSPPSLAHGSAEGGLGPRLAEEVLTLHGLDPARTGWVEQFDDSGGGDRFEAVTFERDPETGLLDHPTRSEVSQTSIELWIGRSLD